MSDGVHPRLLFYYRTPDRYLYMSHLLHLVVLHLHYAAACGSILQGSTLREVCARDVSDILSYTQDNMSLYYRDGPGYIT